MCITPTSQTTIKWHSKEDMEIFNLLQHPIWVFDIENKSMWWANTAALELWNAESLDALLSRNFRDDMSEATARRLADYVERFQRGERVTEQVCFLESFFFFNVVL